ncbi:hypothetical protein P4257_22550 [Bacillus thuringiensis]|nr:hypothetical protein [Bacillus thuringiensis]MED2812221.1 hypothetical protein [Bacillus thuringiensis]MED2829115.1 hypothetical protein [Bacillus thuringiensis]MED2831314.1 hypothetical protein [Bacillus thuringiensis]MED2858344.1 hypothetical protein [Bacillus thuringiensis]
MKLEEYYDLQSKSILSRLKKYPVEVVNKKGEVIPLVDWYVYGIPVAATQKHLEKYAAKLGARLEYKVEKKVAKIEFNHIKSPTLVNEVWALGSYDGYKDQFIRLMGIDLSSKTELKDKGFAIDHWLSKGQIEESKSESIYLRLILADASKNASHGGSHERKAANYKEHPIQSTKDFEFMTPPQLLKAFEKRFSQAVLNQKRNKKEKEDIVKFLMKVLDVPRDFVEKHYLEHFYNYYYKNKWGE